MMECSRTETSNLKEDSSPTGNVNLRAIGFPVGSLFPKEVIMLPWAWDPRLWTEQMMYFGWLLIVIVGIALALSILAAMLGMLERIKDQETYKPNPDKKPLVHVLNRRQRKSADA